MKGIKILGTNMIIVATVDTKSKSTLTQSRVPNHFTDQYRQCSLLCTSVGKQFSLFPYLMNKCWHMLTVTPLHTAKAFLL